MATTAIVAEILIVGLEGATWVSLLLLTIFGTGWVHLAALKGWEGLVTIAVLAAAYVLGILIDRAADTGHGWIQGVWPGRIVDKPAGISPMRLVVFLEGSGISSFVDYQRSRLRIARATVFNLAIALPVTVAFLLARSNLGWMVAAAAGLLALLAVLAELAYRRIEFAYVARLSDAYRMLKKLPNAELAAAVPYRRGEHGLEFLLVRTKGGGKWTFPKGHRKKGETLAEAAAREAHEEAGVTGRLEGKRLADYLYPPGSRPGRTDDYRVAAFLLEVERDDLPRDAEESRRERSWCEFDAARAKLAEGGREPKYVAEMERVLLAAARELEREQD